MTWERRGRVATGAFYVFLFAVCFLILLPTMLEGKLSGAPATQAKWVFVFQTISGNWTGTQGAYIDDWWFAFSAVIAVLLNNSLAIVLITLIWRWNVERARAMKLSQAFVTRDEMNKQALFRRLSNDPDTMKRINEAFSEGQSDWAEHLVEVFGKEDADRLLSSLGENI